MPTYEYQCNDCNNVFEALQKISEAPLTECPKCQGKHVQRLISATSFQLKGSGWYKTDYSSGSSKNNSTNSPATSNEPVSSEKKDVTTTPKAESSTTSPSPSVPSAEKKS